ncbi:MAG TPA: aldehyde dehydrogenase family protein, partial [Candidatus Paceibacterota bacterium]|nr:aldehyde dehydrogenase family protein [Candidatus Paceibacterota bacterium]
MKLSRNAIADTLAAKTAPNFADPKTHQAILAGRAALAKGYLGKEYAHLIAGRHLLAGPSVGTYVSVNPNDTRMTIGRFQHFDPVQMPLDHLLPMMRKEMRTRYHHTTPEEMIDALVSIHELARERFWLLVAAKQYETGQSLAEAYWETDEEVDFPLAHAYYLQEFWNAGQVMPTADICGQFNGMRLVPHGIFATISPFNFPGAIGMRMNTLALAGMNPVIEKSSDKSSLCGHLMMSIIAEGLARAGIDPSMLVGFAPGPGGTMADALLSSSDVAGFSFTGSSDVYETIHRKHWELRRHGWGGKMRLAE